MKSDERVWVNCPKWQERWTIEKELRSGAQGKSFLARRKSDGTLCFLKTSRGTAKRQRARFFREASAYESFDIKMIPRLVESNAHRHKDSGFEPYLASE